MPRWTETIIPLLLLLIGLGLVSYGSYQIYKPAGYIVCGLILGILGLHLDSTPPNR